MKTENETHMMIGSRLSYRNIVYVTHTSENGHTST